MQKPVVITQFLPKLTVVVPSAVETVEFPCHFPGLRADVSIPIKKAFYAKPWHFVISPDLKLPVLNARTQVSPFTFARAVRLNLILREIARQLSYAFISLMPSILYLMQRLPSELSESFALVVQKHRMDQGLSRAALAEQSGLHQTYIGLLERGERSPNLDTAQAIARALGVSLSRLITESESFQNRKA